MEKYCPSLIEPFQFQERKRLVDLAEDGDQFNEEPQDTEDQLGKKTIKNLSICLSLCLPTSFILYLNFTPFMI
jgi:hypothetical protein